MPIIKGDQQLVHEAMGKITTLSLADAKARLDAPGVVFVDIRDVRELEREGLVPGALHAPRGMLEFWVDPDSPYYKEIRVTPLFCIAVRPCAQVWPLRVCRKWAWPRSCRLGECSVHGKKAGYPVAGR